MEKNEEFTWFGSSTSAPYVFLNLPSSILLCWCIYSFSLKGISRYFLAKRLNVYSNVVGVQIIWVVFVLKRKRVSCLQVTFILRIELSQPNSLVLALAHETGIASHNTILYIGCSCVILSFPSISSWIDRYIFVSNI